MKLTARLWLVMLPSICVALESTLVNPSFEIPMDITMPMDHRPLAWGTWGGWFNRETGWSPVRTGDAIMGYHHFRIGDSDSSGIYQDVPDIPAGTPCTFTVFATRDNGTDVDRIEMRLETLGGSTPFALQTYEPRDLKVNKWTLLQVTGTNPLPGLRVVVAIFPRSRSPRRGALKFDDATLVISEKSAANVAMKTDDKRKHGPAMMVPLSTANPNLVKRAMPSRLSVKTSRRTF